MNRIKTIAKAIWAGTQATAHWVRKHPKVASYLAGFVCGFVVGVLVN